jgi:hypothetical protein
MGEIPMFNKFLWRLWVALSLLWLGFLAMAGAFTQTPAPAGLDPMVCGPPIALGAVLLAISWVAGAFA